MRSSRSEVKRELSEIEEKLMSDPGLSPSEVVERNTKLQERFTGLSSRLAVIDAPKHLRYRGAKSGVSYLNLSGIVLSKLIAILYESEKKQ